MKNTVLLSVITLFFSGCSNPDNDATLNLSSEIGFELNNIKNMNTRAGYDSPSDITASDPGFGVYIVDDPADLISSGNRADNHNIKWDGSTWINETTRIFGTKLEWPEKGTVSAFAYCPYRADGTDDITKIQIGIESNQTTLAKLKASDFICAKAFNCQKNENGTIPLTFYHQLSKLKLNLTWDAGEDLSSVNICNVFKSGTYNLATNKVTTSKTHQSRPQAYIYNKSSNSATAEVILMPQEISVGKFITIITEKSGQKIYYTLSLPENLILDASSQYNFNVALKSGVEELTIPLNPSILSIEKWGKVERGDWTLDGYVKKMNILKVNYGSDMRGLNLVITPSLPLFKGSRVYIYIDKMPYSGHYISAGDSVGICSNLYGHNLIGKQHQLSIAAQVDGSTSSPSITTEDEFMNYTIEPSEIYIPEVVKITPIYDKTAGTIVLTSSTNVKTDITYKVYQKELGQKDIGIETVSIDAVIPKGTNKSQIIDVSAWDKNLNALVTLKTQSTDTTFPYCCIIRENIYYTLEGESWSSNFEQTEHVLHIVM